MRFLVQFCKKKLHQETPARCVSWTYSSIDIYLLLGCLYFIEEWQRCLGNALQEFEMLLHGDRKSDRIYIGSSWRNAISDSTKMHRWKLIFSQQQQAVTKWKVGHFCKLQCTLLCCSFVRPAYYSHTYASLMQGEITPCCIKKWHRCRF